MAWPASWASAVVDRAAGAIFDTAAIQTRLEHAPPCMDRDSVPPSRWTLRSMRAALPGLAGYSLSGIWRVLQRVGIGRRGTRVQQCSPDPDYAAKLARLEACLGAAATADGRIRVLCMDQMGYTRWPEPGPTWAMRAPAPAPCTERHDSKQQLWRLVGALDVLSGQVHYRENYIVGRRQLIAFYRQLDQAYPDAERLYVVQDNWSIHQHPDVLAALAELPRIEPVFLPTYAPWLNPIEKLWRWLRQTVLRNHRLAGDWQALRQRVRAFLDGFADGSLALLRYVGLRGEGRLAHALTPP
jgi:transposase